jgi:ACS family glucarate transporter-like MFS transporter
MLHSIARFGARHNVLLLAASLSLITYLDRICIMRARAEMQRDLDISDYMMGFIFSAFTLGYTIFEVPGGWMGDRWGARAVLTRIVLAWSLFTALTGFVYPFHISLGYGLFLNAAITLIVIRFLFGVGEAGAYPNLARVVGDWFPAAERGTAQGVIWTAARFGGAIAPLVLGRLSALIGWRWAFAVLGMIGVAWVAVFWWWFRDRPRDHPAVSAAERELIEGRPPVASAAITDRPHGAAPAHDGGHSWPGFAPIFTNLSVLAMCWAAIWVCVGWYFYPTWQPKYLEEVFNFRPDGWLLEVLTGLPFLFGAAGCLVGGRLSDRLIKTNLGQRWGRSVIGLVGFFGAAASVFLSGYSVTPWQAVTLLCLASFLNDLAIPVLWAAAAEVGGRYAGSVAGVMNTAGGIGAILCPILIPIVMGWLPEGMEPAHRWRIIFFGLAGAWVLAALGWLLIDVNQRVRPSVE